MTIPKPEGTGKSRNCPQHLTSPLRLIAQLWKDPVAKVAPDAMRLTWAFGSELEIGTKSPGPEELPSTLLVGKDESIETDSSQSADFNEVLE